MKFRVLYNFSWRTKNGSGQGKEVSETIDVDDDCKVQHLKDHLKTLIHFKLFLKHKDIEITEFEILEILVSEGDNGIL